MVESFLDPAAIATVQEAVRRAFETALELQDPPLFIDFRATSHATGTVTVDEARRVALRIGAGVPLERSAEGAKVGYARGDLRAWAPWSVEPDWTFVLPSGQSGRVVAVPPPRYGIQSAIIEVST